MNNTIHFMRFRKIAGAISISIFLISLLTLGFRGLTLGLDFSGGTLIEISYEEPVELEQIREILIANNFEDSQVVNFGTDLDVLIIVADQSGNSKLGNEIFLFELVNFSSFLIIAVNNAVVFSCGTSILSLTVSTKVDK